MKGRPPREVERVSTTVLRSAYAACQAAGLLRNGRPFRSGFSHPNARREADRKACRGKMRDEAC